MESYKKKCTWRFLLDLELTVEGIMPLKESLIYYIVLNNVQEHGLEDLQKHGFLYDINKVNEIIFYS